MAEHERWGTRNDDYSAWHRSPSIGRYLDDSVDASLMAMIDLDVVLYLEYEKATQEPLAVIEVACDTSNNRGLTGIEYKNAGVTERLAVKAGIFGFVVLYKSSRSERNPADRKAWDIEWFKYKRLHPKPDGRWHFASPEEWADVIYRLRRCKENGRMSDLLDLDMPKVLRTA
jgi:hypothetical protein